MNLTGHWKGNYTYGNGYPKSVMGKSEPFEFDLHDIEGKITGTCIDNVVKSTEGNQSTIEGSFSGDFISFLKRYKHLLAIEEDGNLVQIDNIESDGVHYVGHMKKRFFSGKIYFLGEWQINCVSKDELGNLIKYACEGTWTMSKM